MNYNLIPIVAIVCLVSVITTITCICECFVGGNKKKRRFKDVNAEVLCSQEMEENISNIEKVPILLPEEPKSDILQENNDANV